MSSIPPTNFTNAGGGTATINDNTSASLNMQDFMNLMVKQLENQDPTSPMSADSFFTQMSQLGSVQGMDMLNKQMNVQQAQSLMGKVVTAARPNTDGSNGSDSVTGVVTGLSVSNGKYKLNVQDYNGGLVQVNMDSIQSVAADGNLVSYQGLVGKTVSGIAMTTVNGTSAWKAVTGTVTGLYSNDNQNYAQVKQPDGSTVNMLVGDIKSISGS